MNPVCSCEVPVFAPDIVTMPVEPSRYDDLAIFSNLKNNSHKLLTDVEQRLESIDAFRRNEQVVFRAGRSISKNKWCK